MLHHAAVCCSVVQCGVVHCSVMQILLRVTLAHLCIHSLQEVGLNTSEGVLQRVAACYSTLHRVAMCCSVLQCAVVICSVLQCVAVC